MALNAISFLVSRLETHKIKDERIYSASMVSGKYKLLPAFA